jgi:hypothetical protein
MLSMSLQGTVFTLPLSPSLVFIVRAHAIVSALAGITLICLTLSVFATSPLKTPRQHLCENFSFNLKASFLQT